MWIDRRNTALLASFFVLLVLVFLLFPIPAFSGTFAGHLLGVAGSVFIILTLLYPYRKRVLKKKGKKNPLDQHIFFGLIGPTLVVFHAGHAGSSVIGALAFLSLLVVVLSGIIGFYLFRKINRSIKVQKSELAALNSLFHQRKKEIAPDDIRRYLEIRTGDQRLEIPDNNEEPADEAIRDKCEELHLLAGSIAEREYALQGFTKTKALFSRWNNLHIYLTIFLFAMLTVHSLVTVYYGLRWLS